MDLTALSLGTVVEMKKVHPCGEKRFQVIRTGADFKLKCLGCGRVILLSFSEAEKRLLRVREGK